MKPHVLLVAAVLGSSVIGCTPPDPAEEEKRYAGIACKEWVRQRLKTPAVSTFSVPEIQRLSTGQFIVTGTVDSQNSYGAMLRTRFACTVRHADGNWTLENISL